jgi:translation initiation factor 1 (eIF-1/SUI1)
MNFIMKALIKKNLKGVPDEQIDMIIAMVEKNPELFQKIAEEIKSKMASGLGQQEAAVEVMKSHQEEIKQIMGKQ